MTQARTPLVLILGLGISGLAMARWCAAQGQRVRVADTRIHPPHGQALREQVAGAERVFGQALSADLLCNALGHVEVAAVYCSPGLALADVAPVREAAARSGVFFGGELDLFSQALERLSQAHAYRPHVLAITGTNGKTTVTSLTGHLLERAGLRVAVAGNIGPSLLDTLTRHMQQAQVAWDARPHGAAADSTPKPVPQSSSERAAELEVSAPAREDTSEGREEQDVAWTAASGPVPDVYAQAMPQVWVLELSSFQLEYSSGFEPTAAVILNISEDHLDWHGSLQAYVQAKARIYGRKATAVLNRDDAETMALLPWLSATEPMQGGKGRNRRAALSRPVVRFGLGLPEQAGDWGVQAQADMPWLARTYSEDSGHQPGVVRQGTRRRDDEVFLQRLMPADAMRIRGSHNISNALAALALACTTDASLAAMLHGLREYRGEPHRVQSLGIVQGVEYIDDSKGTNVGATVAALRGLVGPGSRRRLVVILGGDGKGQNFAPLAEPVQQSARAVLLIGRDAGAIEAALRATGVPLHAAPSLEDAVTQAAALAHEGDAVLLSPACASLDMFRDYAHRAEVFAHSVRALALEAGQELGDWA